jgi:cell division protein FtsW
MSGITGFAPAAAIPQAVRRIGGHASREAARDRVPGRVIPGLQRERHDPDYLLLVAAVALSAIGILMVYSSRGVDAARDGSIFDAVTTQLGWGLLGGLVLVLAMRIDYRLWRHFSVLGLGVAIGLLVLVLLPAIPPLIQPIEANGATRWLRIGGLPAFHPAELAKLTLIIYLAHWLVTRGSDVGSVRRGLLPFLVLVGLVAGLVVLEPDLGTTGVLVLTSFTMFFVAGGSLWQLLLLVPVGLAGVAALLMVNPYQMARWTTFLDPFAVASSDGYQTVHGLYALALGGVFGQGLGQSRQPSGLALPAAENDFIFAVVGQEFGLVGGLLVIGLFLLLAWRGIRIAMRAPDPFGSLLAIGITAWLAFQAFINIGVVVQLLPLTGITLPFLSDGGTSLVVALAAVGILLSISRESVPQGESSHEDPHRGRGHRRPHIPRSGRRLPADEPAG